MEKVFANLKEKSILHREQVISIKQYIEEKYATESTQRKAIIFANAVHSIVDQSVNMFKDKHRLQIKSGVLKSAIAKEIFDVNGFDVFKVCSLLPIADKENIKEDFFDNLTKWINENQDIKVSFAETYSMSSFIIDQALSDVVNSLEESMLIDPEIKNYYKNVDISTQVADEQYEQQLDSHISDGRFMNTVGEIVELTTQDIENALKEEIPFEDGLGFNDKVVLDEIVIMPQERIEDALRSKIRELAYGEERPEDDVFDSMDFLNELSAEVDEPRGNYDAEENKELMDEDIEDSDMHINDGWQEEKVRFTTKVETNRLGGYELNPPEIETKGNSLSLTIRLLIIIPATLIVLMIIVVLIVAALNVSSRNASIDSDNDTASSIRSMYEGIPLDATVALNGNLTSTSRTSEDTNIPGVNYEEGSHLPKQLQYQNINEAILKEYLLSHNSMLSEDKYIELFIQVAMDYNVNPLLLVAISGQEQDFVPLNHEYADEMVNNPFNVYVSSKRYNTSFEDACKIAARTVLTSTEDRPDNAEPIKWINKTYAEDVSWHIGVSYFFNELTVLMQNKEQQ